MLNKALLMGLQEYLISTNGVNCSVSTNYSKAKSGQVITVTVHPNDGYAISEVVTSPSMPVTKVNDTTYTFVMPSADCTVTASTYSLVYRITALGSTGGHVSVHATAKQGERVYISLIPDRQYAPSGCTVNGANAIQSSQTSYYFTMPGHDVSVQGSFTKLNSWSLRVMNDAFGYTISVKIRGSRGYSRSQTIGDSGVATFSGIGIDEGITYSVTSSSGSVRATTSGMYKEGNYWYPNQAYYGGNIEVRY